MHETTDDEDYVIVPSVDSYGSETDVKTIA